MLTALHLACGYQHIHAAKLLIEEGADSNIKDMVSSDYSVRV